MSASARAAAESLANRGPVRDRELTLDAQPEGKDLARDEGQMRVQHVPSRSSVPVLMTMTARERQQSTQTLNVQRWNVVSARRNVESGRVLVLLLANQRRASSLRPPRD